MLTLADAWVHTLDPIIVQIGPIALRWYGLSYVLGFVVAAGMLGWLGKRSATPIPPDRALDVIVWLVAGVLIGGRLGYAIFYRPSLFWGFSGGFPFWDLLALTKGGMASHGGILGVCFAAWWIRRGWPDEQGQRTGKSSFWHVTDLIALIATPGLAFGRLANFINGELLGRVVSMPGQPAPGWSVRYWQEVAEKWEHLPEPQRTQLAEAAGVPAQLALADEPIAIEAIERHTALLAEQARSGSDAAITQLTSLISARHPSQLYQALAEGVLTGLVIWWIARRPRVPGVVGAWFLIVYGIGRIATEFVRLPDSHLAHERLIGLSRGQWLSTAMVLAGAMLLWMASRRSKLDSTRLLGWGRSAG